MPAVTRVRALIARAAFGDDTAVIASTVESQLGSIALHAHQRAAVGRVRAALREFGGALLADEPGLGKTFVALAVASSHARVLVAAPASLRSTWRDAAERADRTVQFVSLESLSRREVRERATLVVIDEAHHLCNRATARYARAARATRGAQVLLLSATPVRNRATELDALLALFLGSRARMLSDAERARCIIRRAPGVGTVPRITGPEWHRPPVARQFVAQIRALAAPLPLDDGTVAQTLVVRALVRCWASSAAALDAALRRRLQRGAALEAILAEGRLPTRHELRAWVVGDDAVQLAFPLLASRTTPGAERLLAALHEHLSGVRRLRARVATILSSDTLRRASLLLRLRRASPTARILAFTAYAATATAIYRALRHVPGVALLTAQGARTAGGPRPRADVLQAFSGLAWDATHGSDHDAPGQRAPFAAARDQITMAIATDVLSEGVNLQGASIVVHLDLPWTPAGLEQRVGRAARLGSPHAEVHMHGLAPPLDAQRLLGLTNLLARKRRAALVATQPARDHERLLELLAHWQHDRTAPADVAVPRRVAVACVHATIAGAIAVVRMHGGTRLLAVVGASTTWRVSDSPSAIAALVRGASSRVAPTCAVQHSAARRAVARWLARDRARTDSGTGGSESGARRAFFARVHAWIATAPLHRRAILAERAGALCRAVPESAGVGSEDVLRELAHHPASAADEWFAHAAQALAVVGNVATQTDYAVNAETRTADVVSAAPRTAGGAKHGSHNDDEPLVALLLLRPASRPRATPAPPCDPPSASP